MRNRNYLNPRENDLASRIQLTKTFLRLWMVFAVAAAVLAYFHNDWYRVAEEIVRLFIPGGLFLYLISKNNDPKWIPWPFYYASLHLFTNVVFRVDTFTLDVFMILPLILSGYIAMKRTHAIWYSGFSALIMMASFAVMEFHHKTPMAIEEPHQSKNVYLIAITVVLSIGLLNHFKTLFDNNIEKLEESLRSVNAYNRDNQLLINLITHDINNHLGRLLMSVEFLEHVQDDPKKFKKHYELAVSSVVDVRDVISNFRMLRGQEEEGDLEVKTKEIRVDGVLQKLELIFKEPLSAKKLKLVKIIHEGVDTVAVEPISFNHHLMANIMGNAIKFSRAEAEVEVSVFNLEDRVCFEITNTASKEHLNNLANMKSKKRVLSKKGTHNESGQGLGMKLVNQIGQFSDVEWQVAWKATEDGNHIRVTNIVTVPRKVEVSEQATPTQKAS